jgi:type VII secretion-associated serine protease mycosin
VPSLSGLTAALLVATTVLAHQAAAPQWALDAHHFDSSRIWRESTGRGVTVAVVDTGVDANHPDLAGRVLVGADFTGTAADGRMDTSSTAHGTSVAGVIAADGGAGGLTGLAPEVKILPVRVATDLAADPAAMAQGIDYAATHGAQIINVSLCSLVLNPQIRAAVEEAIQRNIVVVAAAGNDGLAGDPAEYPAAIPGVVAVAASDRTGALWPQSESGGFVGLTAPGVDIYTTGARGTRSSVTGTSFAAPHVAAAAALLRSHYPAETAAQIIERLVSTTQRGGQRDAHWGYGIVDPYRALIAAPPAASVTNPLLATAAAAAAATPAGSRNVPVFLISAGAALVVVMIVAALVVRRRRAEE